MSEHKLILLRHGQSIWNLENLGFISELLEMTTTDTGA